MAIAWRGDEAAEGFAGASTVESEEAEDAVDREEGRRPADPDRSPVAAPWPVGGIVAESGADGIERHVPGELEQV
jgi:hypothetical protein